MFAQCVSEWFKEKGLKGEDSHIGSYKIKDTRYDTLYRIFYRPIFPQYIHKIVVNLGISKSDLCFDLETVSLSRVNPFKYTSLRTNS